MSLGRSWITLVLLLLSKSEPLVRGATLGQRFFISGMSCRLCVAGGAAKWAKPLGCPGVQGVTRIKRYPSRDMRWRPVAFHAKPFCQCRWPKDDPVVLKQVLGCLRAPKIRGPARLPTSKSTCSRILLQFFRHIRDDRGRGHSCLHRCPFPPTSRNGMATIEADVIRHKKRFVFSPTRIVGRVLR